MTRLKVYDASILRIVDSGNKPRENNPFKYDGEEILERVVDVSTNRIYFLIKERKILNEITVESTVLNLTVVCSASLFNMECSNTGIGYPINNILKKNSQCGLLLEITDTNRWYVVTLHWLELISIYDGLNFFFLSTSKFWFHNVLEKSNEWKMKFVNFIYNS